MIPRETMHCNYYTPYYVWNSRPFFLNPLTCRYKIISDNRVYVLLALDILSSLINYIHRSKYCDLFVNESITKMIFRRLNFIRTVPFELEGKSFRKSWYFTVGCVATKCVGCPNVLARASHALTSVFRTKSRIEKKTGGTCVKFCSQENSILRNHPISFPSFVLVAAFKRGYIKIRRIYQTNVNV